MATKKPTKQEIDSLTLKDSLAWGIVNIDLLENRQWEISTRKWAVEPFQMLNPYDIETNPLGLARRMSIIKSTQAGISTMSLTKALHFAYNWSVRIGYTLPRLQDTLDFVTTRVDPIIKASPLLSSRLGQPDSAHAKQIGNSYIFFIEMTTEPRMMPLDSLFVDEVDLSDPDNLSTVLNRLDASPWKLNMFLSTPTVSNFGIHAYYLSSDQREWMVKCSQCNHWQTMNWEQNLRVIGAANNPSKVFYGCEKCNHELTLSHIQTGRWVAQKPNLSSTHIGYHISQMMTTDAETMYTHFRDPQTKLIEFYRKRLGMPYEIGGGSIEREDFLVNCFDEPYDLEPVWDGESDYYLGADQGNELQVIIAKAKRGTKRLKVVKVEMIPMEHGFDRLATLISLFHVKRAVVDGNPNRHNVIKLVKTFPGRVVMADYAEQKEVVKAKYTIKELDNITTAVTINRTAGFDGMIESIRGGQWQLPGNPPILHPDIELLIDHVTAIKRDIEVRRTSAGEVEVAVWKRLRAEHLAHSMLYCKTAFELDRTRGGRVAVIDKAQTKKQENVEKEVMVKRIIGALIDTPKKQLEEFIERFDEDYELPFPLSHLLGQALITDSIDDIKEVIITKLLNP